MNILNNIKYFFEDLYWDTKFYIQDKLEERKWNKALSQEDDLFVDEYTEEVEIEEKPKKKKSKKKTSKKSKKTL
jgi:hypothetical protein